MLPSHIKMLGTQDVAVVNFMGPCRTAGMFMWPACKDAQKCCALVPEAKHSGGQCFSLHTMQLSLNIKDIKS
ncbi:hypothetical protein MAR_036575, partial [Mya arenaria]